MHNYQGINDTDKKNSGFNWVQMTLFRIARCALAFAVDVLSGSFCACLRNKMGNIGSQSVKTQTGVYVFCTHYSPY